MAQILLPAAPVQPPGIGGAVPDLQQHGTGLRAPAGPALLLAGSSSHLRLLWRASRIPPELLGFYGRQKNQSTLGGLKFRKSGGTNEWKGGVGFMMQSNCCSALKSWVRLEVISGILETNIKPRRAQRGLLQLLWLWLNWSLNVSSHSQLHIIVFYCSIAPLTLHFYFIESLGEAVLF